MRPLPCDSQFIFFGSADEQNSDVGQYLRHNTRSRHRDLHVEVDRGEMRKGGQDSTARHAAYFLAEDLPLAAPSGWSSSSL